MEVDHKRSRKAASSDLVVTTESLNLGFSYSHICAPPPQNTPHSTMQLEGRSGQMCMGADRPREDGRSECIGGLNREAGSGDSLAVSWVWLEAENKQGE